MRFRYRERLVTGQRVLIKLFTMGLLPGPGRRLLEKRTWTIEAGEAAGLKLGFPQNLDYVLGASEWPMQRCLAQELTPGGVFYDVGANVGFFSLLASKRVGRQGVVYSLEPVSENAAAIRRNARLNAMTNLSVFEVAVDAYSRQGELLIAEWDGGSSLCSADTPSLEPRQRRVVRVVALDDLIEAEGLLPPTLVKIDVEGSEMGTLQGMLKTIEKFKPKLVYEVDGAEKADFEGRWLALDQFLMGHGYHIIHLDDSYPDLNWNVGHSLAVPIVSRRDARRS